MKNKTLKRCLACDDGRRLSRVAIASSVVFVRICLSIINNRKHIIVLTILLFKVDGGMTQSSVLMQMQADALNINVGAKNLTIISFEFCLSHSLSVPRSPIFFRSCVVFLNLNRLKINSYDDAECPANRETTSLGAGEL